MLKAKADEKSDEFKYDGNVFYKRNEFYNALMCYNKSICFAESKEKLALAYANRSAVFFELKKYDECLLNIQWAKENGYPTDKIQKLNEREEKCNELKASEVKDPADDPMEFFKLSYPANPKVPFVIDSLELRKTKNGHGVFTNRDLKAGDVVAIEEFAFKRIFCPGQYNRCCYCLNVNMMNLIPCIKTASLMFCSNQCRTTAYKVYDKNYEHIVVYGEMHFDVDTLLKEFEQAFGGRKKLQKFINQNDFKKLKKTIFDFDWNNKEAIDKYKAICLLSLDGRKNDLTPGLCSLFSSTETRKSREEDKLLDRFISVLNEKGSFIRYEYFRASEQMCPKAVHDGSSLLLFDSLFNTSCMANTLPVLVENKQITIALKPIKAGQQLLLNTCLLNYHKSTKMLREILLGSKCDCYACENNLIPADFICKDSRVLSEAIENSEIAYKKVNKTKAQLKENWKIITAYCDNPRSLEVAELVHDSARMLKDLAYAASFPC